MRLTNIRSNVAWLLFATGIPAMHATEAWRAEADARIEKVRKGDFEIQALRPDGSPLANAELDVMLIRHAFYFGTAVAPHHLADPSPAGELYRKLIVSHFNMIVDEYSTKWTTIEREPGKRSFKMPDLVAEFAAKHDLALRGHCLLWGEPQFMQEWLRALPPEEVKARAMAHAVEVAERYKGKVVCWDVINELTTGGWYDQHVGPSFKFDVFEAVQKIDPNAALFLNEQHILRNAEILHKLLDLIAWFKSENVQVGGIGAQEFSAHEVALETAPDGTKFRRLPPEVMWSHLDRLAETGIPVQLTEICAGAWDVNARADALETILRVAFAHHAVDAFVLWGFMEGKLWKANGFLINGDGSYNEAGKRVFGLWNKEWKTKLTVKTDAQGVARFRGFYGTYRVKASDEEVARCKLTRESPNAQVALKPPGSKSL